MLIKLFTIPVGDSGGALFNIRFPMKHQDMSLSSPVRKRGCIEVGRLQNSDWNKDFQKNESDTSKKLPNTNVI